MNNNKYDTERQQAIDYFINTPKQQDIYIIDPDTVDSNETYLQIQFEVNPLRNEKNTCDSHRNVI